MKPDVLIRKADFRAPRIVYGAAEWLICAVTAASMTGCAANTEIARWKTARVMQIVEGKDLTFIQDRECVAFLPGEQIARSRFAVISYSKGRGRGHGHRSRTVLIPDVADLEVGDEVRINVLDCASPLVRIPR